MRVLLTILSMALFLSVVLPFRASAEECPQTAVISDSGGVMCDVTRDCWACEGITQHTCTNGTVYYECCYQMGEGSSFHHCAHVVPEDAVIWPVEPPPPPPTWWDEVTAEFSWPWWAGLRAESAVVTFDHVDGESWVSIDGEVTGGAFGSVYAAGGNYNADAGQDCAGIDHTRCFLALTLAWGNAYSAATGPAEFGMVSGDGSIRLSCFRSPDTGAVHDCAAAWATGGGWSSPVACSGPQGADLGTCVGVAWEQAH